MARHVRTVSQNRAVPQTVPSLKTSTESTPTSSHAEIHTDATNSPVKLHAREKSDGARGVVRKVGNTDPTMVTSGHTVAMGRGHVQQYTNDKPFLTGKHSYSKVCRQLLYQLSSKVILQ